MKFIRRWFIYGRLSASFVVELISLHWLRQKRRSWRDGGFLTLWKYLGGVNSMFRPLKCHVLSFKTVHIIKDERLVSKRKVKLIFRGAYTGCQEPGSLCLEIIDVGCKLKQFDGLTWLTPYFTTIYATAWRRDPESEKWAADFKYRRRKMEPAVQCRFHLWVTTRT